MMLLNVHAVERRGVYSLGPGLRYALWLQGCPFSCPGCATPEACEVVANQIITAESLARDIAASPCTGLTVSGGEPFLQAEALAFLLKSVREHRPDMTVIVFTGFTIGNLQSREAKEALSCIDLLIDGKYVESLDDGVGLRGSSNQRCHFLSERLIPWKDEITAGKRSLDISFHNGIIDASGIPLRGSNSANATLTENGAE